MKFTFKIMWGERRRLYGILLEQIVVFAILLFCLKYLVNSLSSYYERGRLNVENIIMFSSQNGHEETETSKALMNAITSNLQSSPFVEGITNTQFFAPYLRDEVFYLKDSVLVGERKIRTFIKGVDDKTQKVFDINLLQGEWISSPRLENNNIAAVVTKDFLADAEITSYPIGKTFKYNNETFQITGVMEGLKQNVISDPVTAIMVHVDIMNKYSPYSENYVKIRSGYKSECYGYINNEFKRLSENKNIIPLITSLEELEKTRLANTYLIVVLFCIPSLFLFIFAFVGTVGVTSVNYQRRIKEYAIKFAIGASKKNIISTFLFESLTITFIAFIPGIVIYIVSTGNNFTITDIFILLTMMIIVILFSVSSAYIPIRKFFKLCPAETLKKE